MPYIKQVERLDLEYLRLPDTPGKLNYMVSQLIKTYLIVKGESYQTYNDIIGALECAKIELYRRRIAPYEDKKIAENGDL